MEFWKYPINITPKKGQENLAQKKMTFHNSKVVVPNKESGCLLFISSNGFSFYVTQWESFWRQFLLKISFEDLLFLKISFDSVGTGLSFYFCSLLPLESRTFPLYCLNGRITPTESFKCTGCVGCGKCHRTRICVRFLESLYWLKSVRTLRGTFENYPTVAYHHMKWSHLDWSGG